jgi:hypothetical protein
MGSWALNELLSVCFHTELRGYLMTNVILLSASRLLHPALEQCAGLGSRCGGVTR